MQETTRGMVAAALLTRAARDVPGDADNVADLDVDAVGPDLDDPTDALMP
jgi:hypothetical protein